MADKKWTGDMVVDGGRFELINTAEIQKGDLIIIDPSRQEDPVEVLGVRPNEEREEVYLDMATNETWRRGINAIQWIFLED